MTDNRTTDLLPCPFCGGEAEVIEADYGMYMTGYAVYCRKCCLKLGVTGRLGETYEWSPVFNTEAEAIAAWNTRSDYHGYEQAAIEAWKSIKEWNTRATGGTLTAEQVSEAVMSADRWEKPMGDTGLTNTHLIIRDDGWQAIADELNARAERTCRDVAIEGEWFECSECHTVKQLIHPYYCPNCGRKVVGE